MKPHNALRGLIFATTLACCTLFLAEESLAFYNPSTGRWLSRDPVGETGVSLLYGFGSSAGHSAESYASSDQIGGPNLYCFVHNDAIGNIDPQGLSSFSYSSEGRSQRDPWYGSFWVASESGIRGTSDASADQWVYNFWPTRGGICNTGTKYPGHIGTFVDGWAKNNCSRQVSAKVQCAAVYVVIAVADSPVLITSALANRPGASKLLGDRLPEHRKTQTRSTVLVNVAVETRTRTLSLGPGQAYELYHINPSVAGFRH